MARARPRISRFNRIDLLIVLIGAIVIGVHVYTYYPFYCDDALISMRYAQRLLHGHGLTWTDGPRVEGYSNLLWILACASLGRLGMDLILATRVLGALSAVGVLAALLYRRATSESSRLPLVLGTATWALAAPVAVWTLAGLEAPLVALLLAWGFVLLMAATERPDGARSRFLAAGLCFGLLNLTRPDGPLFALLAAAWLVLIVRTRRANTLSFLFAPVVLMVAQLAFRRSYYGEWVPNVWHIKVTPSFAHLAAGAKYVAGGLLSLMPASGLAIAGLAGVIVRDPARRRPALLLLATMTVWVAYVAFIGGDIFHGWRHMVPVVVMMVLALMLTLEWLTRDRSLRKWLPLAVLAAGWFTVGQFLDASNRKAKKDLWVWNTEVVGRTLGEAFAGSRPLLAVTAAGGIPYWSGLDCLDMLGLNDRTIARAAPPGLGRHWIGHDHADAKYVMARRPDLIHFGTAAGGEPVHLYREQLTDIPEFWREYTLCRIGGLHPFQFATQIYIDRTSHKVGIIRTPERIEVPPYFMEGSTAGWIEELHRFVVILEPGTIIGVRALEVGAGVWEIKLPTAPAEVEFVDVETRAVTRPSISNGVRTIVLDAPVTVHVMIRGVPEKGVLVYGLTLVRR